MNDKRPVFEEKIGDDDCYIITEFHDLNEPVLTVRASDGDDPQTPNGQLEFEILAGNFLITFWKEKIFLETIIQLPGDDHKLFRLEQSGKSSAKIFPKEPLKGRYGNYTLTVQASDKGKPANTATDQYSICVQVRLIFCI